MNHPRRNFVLALAVFFVWVGALALMAGFSGEPPRQKVPATPSHAATPTGSVGVLFFSNRGV